MKNRFLHHIPGGLGRFFIFHNSRVQLFSKLFKKTYAFKIQHLFLIDLFNMLWFLISLVATVTTSENVGSHTDILCTRLGKLQNFFTESLEERPEMVSVLYHSFPRKCELSPPREIRYMVFPSHDDIDLHFTAHLNIPLRLTY